MTTGFKIHSSSNHSAQVLAKALQQIQDDRSRRSIVQENYIQMVDKIIDQPQPYWYLKKYSNGHPYLRIVHGAIISEVLRPRWQVKERFAKKCTSCGREYVNEVDHCEDCEPGYAQAKEDFEDQQRQRETEAKLKQQAMQNQPIEKAPFKIPNFQGPTLLRDPNPQEKKRLEAFFDEPNRDDEMADIITSWMKDYCACDDWYGSIVKVTGTQVALYAEDAAEIFICADGHGRLGNGVWYCPECWYHNAGQTDPAPTYDKTYTEQGNCERCGIELVETAYVQKKQGGSDVLARFSRGEIIHSNGDPWLPKLYGNSKVPAILTELRTAMAKTQFDFALYSKGRMNKLVGLTDEDDKKADSIAESVKHQKEIVKFDNYTGQITRDPAIDLFISAKGGIDVFDMMPDAQKMQSLELMEWILVKICGAVYGVQPIMMNQQTSPTGYHERMSVSVDKDRTRERQHMIEDALNEQLVVNALGIHDWQFKFNDVESRNELEEATIWLEKVRAGKEAVNAGLDAELTEEGDLKISGKFVKQEFGASADGFMFNNPKDKAKDKSMPEGASLKKGESWMVTKIQKEEEKKDAV